MYLNSKIDMAKVKKTSEQSGMVKHDPEVVTLVRVAVATIPDMNIGKFYDEAATEKLKKLKSK